MGDADGGDEGVALQMLCGWCRQRFFLCTSCYRGNGYCAADCRRESQAEIDARKQRTYRTTPAGRANHRERQ